MKREEKTVKTMMILIVVCAAQANFETLEETAKENRRRVFCATLLNNTFHKIASVRFLYM